MALIQLDGLTNILEKSTKLYTRIETSQCAPQRCPHGVRFFKDWGDSHTAAGTWKQ